MNRLPFTPCRCPSRPRRLVIAFAALSLPAAPALAASYAGWLTQIGVSDSIMSAGNWGTGQVLGVVDTGIAARHPAFASGQVSAALSGCAAVSFRCANGVADDNGHGTAVAAIAAGNLAAPFSTSYGGYAVPLRSVLSAAPNANIIAEKVLNAAGSGYSADVANGVRKAADAGASVINVSITYGNSADIVAAINYATAKGATIVWAGGNSSVNLINGAGTIGLTPQAISRLVFVGSVNAKNGLSSFSNKPGSGRITATTGAASQYAARWLVAPGENIVAPYVLAGNSTWAYWSGTSMAAPIVSGSLLLLQGAWPILKTQGTGANLLLATASDLGAAGIDATYGNGLVNLLRAFQPYGTLTVTQLNGKVVAVSSLTGSLLSSGAFGSLSSLQAKLANYTAFDSFTRNFSVNLSGLIKAPSTPAKLNALPTNTNRGVRAIKLRDGGEVSFAYTERLSGTENLGRFGYRADIEGAHPRDMLVMFNDARGYSTALGYGYPVGYAYARALFGQDDLARLSSELGVNSLQTLAQGGAMLSWGAPLNEDLRFALSWSSSSRPATYDPQPAWATPQAQSYGLGLSYRLAAGFNLGFSFNVLEERQGLLGSTSGGDAAVSLGQHARSMSYGASLGYNLDERTAVLAEASLSRSLSDGGEGLVSGTTPILSHAWGLSLQRLGVWHRTDRVSLSLRQPLRVVSGQAGIHMASVDELGYPVYQTEWVSLKPDGQERNLSLAYDMQTSRRSSLALAVVLRKDAQNVRDADDKGISAVWKTRF